MTYPRGVHYGCGTNLVPGWLNLDYAPPTAGVAAGLQFLAVDLSLGHPFADGSFNFGYAEDFLEHLSQAQSLQFLGEAHRTLRRGGLSAAANVLFQLGFTAALARQLKPADFGLMAMVALRLFSYFSQLGLGAALVQRERLDPQDVRCALGITWLMCIAAAAGVAVSAPALGYFFRDDGVVPLVRVLSLNLVLVGLGTVSMALLRRALRYRALAVLETASDALGYGVVGVVAAWSGAGVWSLVATTFAQSTLCFVGAWALTRHSLRPSLRGDRAGLLGYGARYSAVGFLEFLSANVDAALVGRLLGGRRWASTTAPPC